MSAPRKKRTAGLRFFRFHFLRRLWIFPLVLGWTVLSLYSVLSYKEGGLEAVAKSLAQIFEIYLIVPAVILSIFIFTNSAELEFCQCYGFSSVKLGLIQLFPTVFFSLLCIGLSAFLLPVEVLVLYPTFRWILFLTSAVNLLTVVSAVVLSRVLVRNLFGTLGIAVVLYYGITMSNYIRGPYAYYFNGGALFRMILDGLPLEEFYVNRGIFAAFAILLSAISIRILRGSRYTEKDI